MFFYLLYKNPIFVSVVKKLYTCFFRSIVEMQSAILREESQINGVGIFYTAFFAINFSHSKHFCTRTEVSENKWQLYTAVFTSNSSLDNCDATMQLPLDWDSAFQFYCIFNISQWTKPCWGFFRTWIIHYLFVHSPKLKIHWTKKTKDVNFNQLKIVVNIPTQSYKRQF